MAVVAHPQRLTALLARLFQWGQGDRVRRFGTRGSGSSDHGRSPAKLFILLLAFLQATPVVKLSFPFRVSLVIITLLVAFAGFGGLLIRQPTTFLWLFLVFAVLVLISLLSGRAVSAWSRR